MKKFKSFLFAAVALLFTAVAFTSCGTDDSTSIYTYYVQMKITLQDPDNELNAINPNLKSDMENTLKSYKKTLSANSMDALGTKLKEYLTDLGKELDKYEEKYPELEKTNAYIILTGSGDSSYSQSYYFDQSKNK